MKIEPIITHRTMAPYLEQLSREPEFKPGPSNYHPSGNEWYRAPVILEFPLGELAKDFLTTLALTGWKPPTMTKLTGTEQFDAQGLEGKAQVKKDLFSALMNLQFLLPEYRGRIVRA